MALPVLRHAVGDGVLPALTVAPAPANGPGLGVRRGKKARLPSPSRLWLSLPTPTVLPMLCPRTQRNGGWRREPYSLEALQGEVGGQVGVGAWLPLAGEAVGCEVHKAGQVVGCGGRVCVWGGESEGFR